MQQQMHPPIVAGAASDGGEDFVGPASHAPPRVYTSALHVLSRRPAAAAVSGRGAPRGRREQQALLQRDALLALHLSSDWPFVLVRANRRF